MEKRLQKEGRDGAKAKTIPVVDVTGDGSKVRCCKEQYCTSMRYHYMPVRMAAIQKSTINPGEGVEKREPSYTVGGIAN